MKKIILYSTLILAFVACFKEEESLPSIKPSVVELRQNWDSSGMQFFNLEKRQVVKTVDAFSWDLAFDCAKGKFGIYTNSSQGVSVFDTKIRLFDSAIENKKFRWTFESPSSPVATSPLSEWGDFSFASPQSFMHVYIVNRGKDANGNILGSKKIQIVRFLDNKYHVIHSNLDGSGKIITEIEKKDKYNKVYMTLDGGAIGIYLEPEKSTWDLLFVPHADTLRGINPYHQIIRANYVVSDAVLLNPSKCQSSIDSLKLFNEFSYFDAQQSNFNNYVNGIGNKWYKWNQSTTSYVLDKRYNFVIQSKNKYYLIKFIDFDKPSKVKNKIKFALKNL